MTAPALIHVGLRYDDFSADSPASIEARILEICARHRVPITFGVIPEVEAPGPDGAYVRRPLPESKFDVLREGLKSGILDIALHGFTHRSYRTDCKTEFAGLGREEQEARIKRGKAILEEAGLPVRCFIPPWNAYDEDTLGVLAAAGLTVLSADGEGPVGEAPSLRFVPATCVFPAMRKAVAQAGAAIRRRPDEAVAVVPYIHPYEFVESGSPRAVFSLERFEEELAWLSRQPGVEPRGLTAMGGSSYASPARYAIYSHLRRLAPEWLERTLRPAFRVYPRPGFPGVGGYARLAALVHVLDLPGIPGRRPARA